MKVRYRKNIRRIILSILCMLMLVTWMPMQKAEAATFAGGDGTAGNPWQIATAEQLNLLRNYLGSAHSDKHFIMVNDIDLGPYLSPGGDGYASWGDAGWLPIGTNASNSFFNGGFNGDGHVISGFMINRPTDNNVGLFGATGGELINIGLRDVHIVGRESVGCLAGFLSVTSVSHTFCSGEVQGNNRVGGLVGSATNGAFIQYSFSQVNVEGNDYVGGLVGYTTSNTSPVSKVAFSYSTGSVTGTNYVGGLLGLNNGGLENSFSTGRVTGTAVGGLIGLEAPWASGEYAGKSFWNTETSGQMSAGGSYGVGFVSGIDTASMNQVSTYAGWDFATVWELLPGNVYPTLRGVWEVDQEGMIGPKLEHAYVEANAADRLVLEFDEAVQLTDAGGASSMVFDSELPGGNTAVGLSYLGGSGTSKITLQMDRTLLFDQTMTFSYDITDGNMEDLEAGPLLSVQDVQVTRNAQVSAVDSHYTVDQAANEVRANASHLFAGWTEIGELLSRLNKHPNAAWKVVSAGTAITNASDFDSAAAKAAAATLAAGDELAVKASNGVVRLYAIESDVDHTPPVVTVTLQYPDHTAYSSGSWTNQTVTASVYAADTGSGVDTDTIEYSLDHGTSWTVYTTPVTFADEDSHSFTVRATDKLGNTSTAVTKVINISRSGLTLDIPLAFTADASAYTSGEWTKESVTASVYASQSTSGVNITSTTYSLDGGTTWQAYTSSLLFNSEGTYTLDAKATDSANNEVTASRTIRIDQTAPSVSFGTNGNSPAQTTVTSSVYVIDTGGSGMDSNSLQYAWTQSTSSPGGGTTWTSFTNGDILTQSGVSGDWYLHIRAQDNARNPIPAVSAVSNRFRLYVPSTGSGHKKNTDNQGSLKGNEVRLLDGTTLIDTTVAKKVTRPDGTVVEQVTLDAATFDQALDVLQKDRKYHLTININDTERAVGVQLPASSIVSAAKFAPNMIIEVQLNGSSYQLAILALELERMALELGVDLKELKVNVTIERVNEKAEAEIRQAADLQGLHLASGIIDFKVTVEANGQTKAITDFGGTYMARSIVPNADQANQNLMGVLYEVTTKKFHFVPSQPNVRSDGTQEMVMNVPHNSMYAVVEVQNKTFEDLLGHWAKREVELLASKLIVNGVAENQFAPNNEITRAEFAALLVRSLGLAIAPNGAQTTSPFSDISADTWYAPAVAAAVEANLINGYEDGSFQPNQSISREEIAVIIDRAKRLADTNTKRDQVHVSEVLTRFADQTDMANWSKPSIANLVQDGLINGRSENEFAPQAHTTRAEAAALIERLLKQLKFI
ncbi:S-layer homology domain-containing protein [Paenibacillus chungangensis]|uniref:S-layer homology domain-containing protein n=1 Tax=Paenibacillus chungangensis TaxID=696535 RepID=A0ABW3HTT3_9BACL